MYGRDVHGARQESIPFFKRIIEDLTGNIVQELIYEEEREVLLVKFNWTEFLINIRWDSLALCTKDVIDQTNFWLEKQRMGKDAEI